MNRITCLIAIAMFGFMMVGNLGCESTDDPTDPGGGNAPLEISGTIGAPGGTLRSSDGRLSLTVPPGALAAATDISVKEGAGTDAGPLFDGFDGVKTLDIEPDGLVLAAGATLSYELPIAVRTAKTKEEEESIVDVMIALMEERDDKILIPPQENTYNLDLRSIKFGLTLDYMGDISVGRPIPKDDPEPGDDFGVFKASIGLDFAPVLEEEFNPEMRLYVSEFHSPVDAAQMTMVDPPEGDLESLVGDLEPIESVIDELDGFRRHTMNPGFVAHFTGALGFEAKIGFQLEYDWDKTDLPDGLDWELSDDIKINFGFPKVDFEVLECPEPPCDDPPAGQIDIATGLSGLRDLSAAYYDAGNDPPPVGDGPWLFVTSEGMLQWYRLTLDQEGKITATELIDDMEVIDSNGTVVVAQGSPGDRDRCLFMYGGTHGGWRTHWNGTDWGAIVLEAANVTDASAYLGKSDSRGWVWTNGSSVRFAEHDPSVDLFYENSSISLSQFPDANGGPITATVGDDIESVAVVMDGNPAEIWWHDRSDVFTDALKMGAAQNGARQMRTANGIFAVSNNASNSITIGKWLPTLAVTGHHPVGAGPVGIDVVGLQGGGAAVVSTSATDNTYTILTVDGSGAVTGSATADLPGGCAAEYAVFVPGAVTYVAFSCPGNQDVSLIETALQAAY